ncbi:MAG: hypothetical protein R3F39_20240 [Myxococcota bacterium]
MDQQAVTKAVRAAIGAPTAEVTVLEGVNLPGLSVYSAQISASRGGYSTGVVTAAGEVFSKFPESARRVMDALGPDAGAVPVARVVGFLEGSVDPTYPAYNQVELDKILKPAWRSRAALPTVSKAADGTRVYEYWVRCGEPPLWRTRLSVAPGGGVSISTDDIWDIEADEDDEDGE